ncbi:DNA gyrase inhibitor GyrI [Clostridium acetobutylicum]|uniref:DNA gyrase inhibitory protein, GyrI n=1 Tax=Clostridium acetobutylicum (strain ATCC 824 / DSM 792 / JCM 1419 / IAM 19013 / LMG 5710 / NBRC 13948 / NRRL B-527 / VKM B-1787 / 2291 / W) TaxID=272562 RepID=Q97DI7_CLOAB|nr:MULTISPECIES: GyrI-like domain-containing protein [Clostridium]AAK81416.1 DNA gyrase inhibitory protein, GyrI [Clostridium acetobutylicum ATCC 824]ADZ22531.1 DNA gyrase inhibitory protein, GyrI [Clostridium acetobutylicum EA 2018]AEI33937.1 DNA gyrase inhibitory protein, GyrI [Clostridium acetobutylicum DSM 1731]AWV80913.1 DNA gyrase inhibitor [Clostridium acetobutylicum]MBC2393761.1 DNA gyrase inhibitor [Clostridium acetobutylicum]
MDTNIEMIPAYKIAYIRRTGAYGLDNVQIMEQLKSWAREENLFNESSIILGIAQDNPKVTEPKDCRYDACLVVSDEFKVNNNYINFGETFGGKYCVFKISHTADKVQKAWMEIFSELSKRNYKLDDRRPILERYAVQMINNHYCEICVPIL